MFLKISQKRGWQQTKERVSSSGGWEVYQEMKKGDDYCEENDERSCVRKKISTLFIPWDLTNRHHEKHHHHHLLFLHSSWNDFEKRIIPWLRGWEKTAVGINECFVDQESFFFLRDNNIFVKMLVTWNGMISFIVYLDTDVSRSSDIKDFFLQVVYLVCCSLISHLMSHFVYLGEGWSP